MFIDTDVLVIGTGFAGLGMSIRLLQAGTTDFVVSSPKVAGSRMLMPDSGPMPGSTPTMVPTRHPRKAYHSTSGWSATEKPSSRLSSVPIC